MRVPATQNILQGISLLAKVVGGLREGIWWNIQVLEKKEKRESSLIPLIKQVKGKNLNS